MAISRNLTLGTMGLGRAAGDDGGPVPKPTRGTSAGAAAAAPISSALLSAASAPFMTAAVPMMPLTPQPAAEAPVAAAPGITAMPTLGIRDLGVRPFIPPIFELPPGIVFRPPVDKTTTQIAQGAVNQLRGATPAVVREAVSTIKNKNIAADDLLNYLERRTRVGEVLNELANDWSGPTRQDFAEAFQMPNTADKLPVMDAMVSISILNDPDLKNELQAENTTEASQADLLENRRIVWQWPQPGTSFTPPYLIMVAVERQDTTKAQNIIQSILGDLVDFQGYKVPSAAAQKLR